MTGGMMDGYCAIGSPTRLTRPRITVSTEITMATIGRSTKNRLIASPGRRAGRRGRRACGVRRNRRAGPEVLQAAHDDALAGLEPLLHHEQIVRAWAQLYAPDV